MEDILIEPLVRNGQIGPPRVEAAGATLQGERRTTNEDAVFHRTEQTAAGQWVGLYLVCDGLGGHEAGEIASRLAIETIGLELGGLFAQPLRVRPSGAALEEWIRAAIARANAKIHEFAQKQPARAGNLGTTLTLGLIDGATVHVANVGDSRTYLSHSGEVTQITEDHSMAAKLLEAGVISAKAQGLPQRNVIYRALGTQDTVEPDLFRETLEPGDKLLFCSDGLWQAFPDNVELARWLGPATAAEDLCQQLVSEAYRRDGSDDTSAVVVAVR